MNTSLENASRLAAKEIEEMPIEQLLAAISASKNSPFAATIRQIAKFAENYLYPDETQRYHVVTTEIKYVKLKESTYTSFTDKSFIAANEEPFPLAAS